MASLTPADFQRLVAQNNGDEALARKLMAQRGYTIEGEDEVVDEEQDGSDLGVAPGGNLAALQGILSGQRTSIGNLYDTITQNIQQRYRAPDINDMLIAIGTGMMAPPGEGEDGGFGGAIQRGLRGVGTYAAQKSAYDTDLNKMMSQVEIQRAKDLADLEGRYATGAASLLKPRTPRTGFNPVTGVLTNLDTNQPVAEPQPPVLTPEQVAVMSRDPRNRGMKFLTTDGRPMEIK